MYKEEFLNLAGVLNESEVIYKQMYELREDLAALQKYENEIPEETIKRLQLYVPGRMSGWYEHMSEDRYIFFYDTDIVLWKHNCYTPEFEHSHTFFEVLYVYRGKCCNKIGTTVLHMAEGDICFITPGQKHSICVNDDDSIIINIMVKKSTFLNNFFVIMDGSNILTQFFYHSLMDKEESRFLLFHTRNDVFIKSQTEFLFVEYYYHRKYFSKILNSTFTTVFFYTLRNHTVDLELGYREDKGHKIVEILSYIQQHFFEVTLESVAEHFHYHVSYLSRMIKKTTGKSFVELIRDCRMDRACFLLRNSEYAILEISSIVGYENVEHFNRIFKKIYHMSPGRYRKENQQNQ